MKIVGASQTTRPDFLSVEKLRESFAEAYATPANITVTVFSLDNRWNVVGEVLYVTESDLYVSSRLSLSGEIVLEGVQKLSATVLGRYSSTVFPKDWAVGSLELLSGLAGQELDTYNFAVVKNINASIMALLEDGGFEVQPMVGIIDFLDSGVSEIESDANWVLIPSAFVIAVLAYSFLGSETVDRRHDIGIIKTLGAERKRVLGYMETTTTRRGA